MSDIMDRLCEKRGCGVTTNERNFDAREGYHREDEAEVLRAVQEFRLRTGRGFITPTEVYQVMLSLGYRRDV